MTSIERIFGIDTHFITRTDTCSISGKIFFTQIVENTPIRFDDPSDELKHNISRKQAFLFLSPETSPPIIIKTALEFVPEWSIVGSSPIFTHNTLPKIGEPFVGIVSQNGTLLKYGANTIDTYAHVPVCDFQSRLDTYQDQPTTNEYTYYSNIGTLSAKQKNSILQFSQYIKNFPHNEIEKAYNSVQNHSLVRNNPSVHYLVTKISELLGDQLNGTEIPQNMQNIDRLYAIKTQLPHLSTAENDFLQTILNNIEHLPMQYRGVVAHYLPQITLLHQPNKNQKDIINALAIASIKQLKDHPEAKDIVPKETDSLTWKIATSHPNLTPIIDHFHLLM